VVPVTAVSAVPVTAVSAVPVTAVSMCKSYLLLAQWLMQICVLTRIVDLVAVREGPATALLASQEAVVKFKVNT
jgi:hypothetical protein